MRTTGQRLDEHHRAIQQLLDWWGASLPALAALEERVEALSVLVAELGGDPSLSAELTTLRDLLMQQRGVDPR